MSTYELNGTITDGFGRVETDRCGVSQSSRELLRGVWDEAASDSPAVTSRAAEQRRRKRVTVAACAACAAVVMLGVAIALFDQGGHPVHTSGLYTEFREDEAPAEPSTPAVSARPEPRPPGSATASGKDPRGRAVAQEQPPVIAREAPEQLDIDAMILRDVQSARLAASARLLASQPGLEEFSDRAASYLSSAYGDHQSSAKLKPTASEDGS